MGGPWASLDAPGVLGRNPATLANLLRTHIAFRWANGRRCADGFMVTTPTPHDSSPQVLATTTWEPQLSEALEALRTGESQRAEAIYDTLLAAGCNDCRLFSNLGAIALQRDQPDQAILWLEQALAVEPNHARALANYGMALHQLNRGEEAIDTFRRALASDPTIPEAWHNLSVALREWLPPDPISPPPGNQRGSVSRGQG